MNRSWSTIRSYLLWTHERGSLHYDVMVTLILAFIFLTPQWINYKDKPAERNPHPSQVVVTPDESGFIYELDLPNRPGGDGDIRARLRKAIEPLSGEVIILKWEAVEKRVATTRYRVWVRRG